MRQVLGLISFSTRQAPLYTVGGCILSIPLPCEVSSRLFSIQVPLSDYRWVVFIQHITSRSMFIQDMKFHSLKVNFTKGQLNVNAAVPKINYRQGISAQIS